MSKSVEYFEEFPVEYRTSWDNQMVLLPNAFIIKLVDGHPVAFYTMTINDTIEVIIDMQQEEKIPHESWIKETKYGSNVELAYKNIRYIVTTFRAEIDIVSYWRGMFMSLPTYSERAAEIDNINYLINAKYYPTFYDAIRSERKGYISKGRHKQDYVTWYQEGLLARDYQDRFQEGLSYTPDEDSYNGYPPVCPCFEQFGSTVEEIYTYLNLPKYVLEDYLVSYSELPPLLGPGVLKTISREMDVDPYMFQLDYIECANHL